MSPAPAVASRHGRLAVPLEVRDISEVTVDDFVAKQDALVAAMRADPSSSAELLVVAHPPTFTYTTASAPYLLVDPAKIRDGQVALTRVRRGGGTLYVGPGYLALCPLLRLAEIRAIAAVGDYPFFLQECLISALSELGVEARGGDETPGVWLGSRKVASIGVGIRSGVSSFGIYVNVDADLELAGSVPKCGDSCGEPSSLRCELGRSAPTSDTIAEQFELTLKDRM